MNASIIHLTQDRVMSEGNQPGPDTTPHLMIWGERDKVKHLGEVLCFYGGLYGFPRHIGTMLTFACPFREPGKSIFSRKRSSGVIFDKELLMRLIPDDVEDKELEVFADIMGMEDVVKSLTGMNTEFVESLCDVYATVAGWFMALLNGDDHLPASGDKCDEG